MSELSSSLTDVQIRQFRMPDYDAVMETWEICKLPSKPSGRDSREKIEKEITKDTAFFLVATLEDKVIGTVLATNDGRKGWINRLAVLPAYRHQGIAKMLLEKAESHLYNLDLEIIACLIENDNLTSMDFFGKAGYKKHTEITYFSTRKHQDV